MKSYCWLLLAGALAGPAALLEAQQAPASHGIGGADFLAPVHSQPGDPVGGTYGLWASGPAFKASFHEGFAFYPLLGPAYPENLPLRWRTVSVAAGGAELLPEGSEPALAPGDWRVEYRHPGVVEAYDISARGVEQSFVIASRPGGPGDLVIAGRVETRLIAEPRAASHGKLVFRDAAGAAILEYGEAWAIDAAGERVPVASSYADGMIRLHVDGAWLEGAAFPVTVDPLLAAVSIATWGAATFGLPSYPSIGRDDESTTKNIMVFYSRQFSATDFDGYARLCNNDFSNSGLVYTDVTTSWSTGRAGVASVGGANRWTLCLQRDFPSTPNSGVRIYVHDFMDTTLNSGTTLFVGIPAGETHRYPEVGGTAAFSSGTSALLVFQADVTATQANTSSSEVWGVLVNAAAPSLGTRFLLAGSGVGTSLDREFPAVNQESSGGTTSWIAVWQEFNNTISGDDWDVLAARITSAGAVAGTAFFGPSTGPPHKVRPRVAGRVERYYCTYVVTDSLASETGKEIAGQRFDWAESSASPVKKQIRAIATGGSANYVMGGIAFDDISRSHWAIVYQRGGFAAGDVFVDRVGFTGGLTERATVYNKTTGGWSPNITFDNDSQTFMVVHGSNEDPPSGYPVYGRVFNYPGTAINVLYGSGCKGSISASKPLAGTEGFLVNLSGAPGSTAAILMASLAPSTFSLVPFGLGAACDLNLATPLLSSIGATTSAGGSAQLSFNLPDFPVVIGNVYWQWLFLDGTVAWPLKAAVTQGLRTQIR